MAINEWWAADSGERFWMEITDRTDLGGNLHAPQKDQSGNETWSYELVRYVHDGDIILHWWTQMGREPALVGYSLAVGTVFSSTIHWQAHGTYGLAAGSPTTRPSWQFPLTDFTEIELPVDLARARELEPKLRSVKDALNIQHPGSLYYPLSFSDKRPLRTTQAYLTKAPAAMVEAIPEIAHLATSTSTAPIVFEREQAVTTNKVNGQGRLMNAADRKAVERRAVDLADAYLRAAGYKTKDVGDHQPFDILATTEEVELHVEVKGTTGMATTIELTHGEVAQTLGPWGSVLIVVDGIKLSRGDRGIPEATDGTLHIWWEWEIEEKRLAATQYRYILPPENESGSNVSP